MPDISLIEVAHLLGSTKLSEMAEKVGLTFPPAPGHSISAREVATLASQPLEPTNLYQQGKKLMESQHGKFWYEQEAAGRHMARLAAGEPGP